MITWCNAQKSNYASTYISKYDEKHNMFTLNFDIKKNNKYLQNQSQRFSALMKAIYKIVLLSFDV